MNDYATQEEVMETFPELYEGYVIGTDLASGSDYTAVAKCKVLDDNLGLEVVEQETVYSKYQIMLHPDNPFHKSLQKFFDKAGFLTPKQLEAVRK